MKLNEESGYEVLLVKGSSLEPPNANGAKGWEGSSGFLGGSLTPRVVSCHHNYLVLLAAWEAPMPVEMARHPNTRSLFRG